MSYRLAYGDKTTGGSAGAGGSIVALCTIVQDCPISASDCTQQTCINGECQSLDVESGAPCGNGRVCDGQGVCVDCTLAEHCTSIIEDACTKRECVSNICKPMYTQSGALANADLQQMADCQVVVCDGSGGTTTISDVFDIKPDDDACTIDTCVNGVPTYSLAPAGTACGPITTCDSMGSCTGCNSAADCPGTDEFCKLRTCKGAVCGMKYTPANTSLPPALQTPQDCVWLVCDGQGNVMSMVDITDIYVDGNECTQDLCSAAGTPSNPPKPQGTPCGELTIDRIWVFPGNL